MLLMFGAFVRALGYMVYASNTLAKEGSNGDSVLCKTSGWMIQWGVESNGTFLERFHGRVSLC